MIGFNGGSLFLSGKTFLVTRTEEQSGEIVARLQLLGANVIVVPTIKILPRELTEFERNCILNYQNYNVLIFTSANAVRYFIANVTGKKRLGQMVISIGSRTAASLNESGFVVDFIPDKYDSDSLIKSMEKFDWKGKRVLIPEGSMSRHDLAFALRSFGAEVDEVIVYQTVPNDMIEEDIKEKVFRGEFDAAIFFSPSQASNFVQLFGKEVLKGKSVAVIGETTAKAAKEIGLSVSIQPRNSTIDDLIESLIVASKKV
ncbi:MAG: uroporphyrinogen-III synthase [Candidatus Kryptoniota bacterium]